MNDKIVYSRAYVRPCTPRPNTAIRPPAFPSLCPGMLRWLEEYVARLDRGVYKVGPIEVSMPDDSTGVVLYPEYVLSFF